MLSTVSKNGDGNSGGNFYAAWGRIRREMMQMPEIKIKIRDKRAGGTGTVICGNSDYTVVWALDNEWTPYGTKTMRGKPGGRELSGRGIHR